MTQPLYADLRQFEDNLEHLCPNTGYEPQIGAYGLQMGVLRNGAGRDFRVVTQEKYFRNIFKMELSFHYKQEEDTGIRTRRSDKNRKGAKK